MTFTEYVQNYLERQIPGDPIYTNEIASAVADYYKIDRRKAAAATAVAIKRIMDKCKVPELRYYQKGIYYRTATTPFGDLGISREKLIANKYLLPNNGYETGLRLLHHMGLTTQMPSEQLLATNAAKDCIRYDSKLGVSICPPKILADHIRQNELKYETLLYYADKYYHRKTIIRLAHTASQREERI